MQPRKIAGYGYRPDLPDRRDLVVGQHLQLVPPAKRPMVVDLRPKFTPVYDQESIGSCVLNALCAIFDFNRIRIGLKPLFPSRLFAYFNARGYESATNTDSGVQIRDAIKSVGAQGFGVPPESLWPYDPAQFAVKPPDEAYAAALAHKAGLYARVPQTEEAILDVLASGYPILFGFTCYESFEGEEVARTGMLSMPGLDEAVVGGHGVVGVGYDLPKRLVLVRNSWGAKWGVGGHFWMPLDYLLDPNLTGDIWVVRAAQ